MRCCFFLCKYLCLEERLRDEHNVYLQGQVYMYYGLTNYYQNHRRYVKSRDDNQLNGQETDPDSLSTDCKPYDKIGSGNESGSGFAPCGAIANSLFNGKLYLFT